MIKLSESPLIETDWLLKNLEKPQLRIIDCSVVMAKLDDGTFSFVSGLQEWQKHHIPGSIFVDVQTQLSDSQHEINLMMPEPEVFADIMKSLGVGDDSQVVLYDRGNHAWATRVWWMLKVCGFDNVAILNGGWTKWIEENKPISAEVSVYPEAKAFTVNCRSELMVNKERVLELIGEDKCAILNSLPAAVFSGAVSPYERAGRIAGSKNLYCELLLDQERNTYLDLDSMRQKFEAIGITQGQQVITYCGGGIAGSSNAFALTLLGFDNVSLYDGSLSEWTLDPDLPMESD